MDLYLVRHAIAHERDAEQWPDDGQRPLTSEGVERFAEAARGLRRLVPEVDVVLSSPLTRAWQTAELLAEHARWPSPVPCEALASGRTPDEALDAIREHAEADSAALVGHEPNLSELAAYLLTGDGAGLAVVMKKGGVALLRFEGTPAPGAASLVWLLPPKVLRAAAR